MNNQPSPVQDEFSPQEREAIAAVGVSMRKVIEGLEAYAASLEQKPRRSCRPWRRAKLDHRSRAEKVAADLLADLEADTPKR